MAWPFVGDIEAGQGQDFGRIHRRDFEGAWGKIFLLTPHISFISGAGALKLFFRKGLQGGRVLTKFQPPRLKGGDCYQVIPPTSVGRFWWSSGLIMYAVDQFVSFIKMSRNSSHLEPRGTNFQILDLCLLINCLPKLTQFFRHSSTVIWKIILEHLQVAQNFCVLDIVEQVSLNVTCDSF